MLSTSKKEEVSQNCFAIDIVKLSSSKIEEVSQNCSVFDVVKNKTKPEEVSQNSFVLKLADRQIDRQLQLQLQLQVPVVPHKSVAEVSEIGNL